MFSLKTSLHVVRLTIVAVVALGFAQIAHAVPVTVNNFSFENPVFAAEDGSALGVTDWTGATWGVWNPSSTFFTGGTGGTPAGAEGNQIGFKAGGGGNLFQTPTNILANTTYTLTTAVGQRFSATGDLTIELRASSSVGTLLASTFIDDSLIPDGSFSDFVISFNSAAFPLEVTNPLYIVYYDPTASSGVSVDNVRLDAATAEAVPEPSTFVLAALGLAGLGLVAWRRRK